MIKNARINLNLLLAEDNSADMCLLKGLFEEKQAPVTMQWVTDGREVLDYVFRRNAFEHAHTPDIIMLDLGLPCLNGYEVLKELKATEGRTSRIPIIVLTTSQSIDDVEQCEGLGVDAFHSKPCDLDGYMALVQKLLDQEFPRLAFAPPYYEDVN